MCNIIVITSVIHLLKEARTAMGFSQVRLASLSEVSLPTIQNIEAGKGNPSLEVLQRLSKALGLKLSLVAESADWDSLVACGLPLSPSSDVEYRPNPELLCSQLKLACTELKSTKGAETRKKIAVQAMLWALATEFPTFYKKNISASQASAFLPKTPTGPLIKLRRIAVETLSRYL